MSYKGISICQAKSGHTDPRSGLARKVFGNLQYPLTNEKRATRCGLQHYNLPLVQLNVLLALMKDAHGGSIP
jgi:hypothetical protein